MGEWTIVPDETTSATTPTASDWKIVDDKAPATDKGPVGRSIEAGKGMQSKAASDEALGLDTGPVNTIYVSPLVRRMFPSVAAELDKQPTNAVESKRKAELSKLVDAQTGLNEASRGVGALGAAGPLAAGGEALGAAAGLGKAAGRLLGGSLAGAGTTAVSEGNVKHAAEGAAVGAVLTGASDLMNFLVKRADIAGSARSFARAKGGEEGASLLAPEVDAVVKKYNLASVKQPKVALEAIEAGITRAESAANRAREALSKSGNVIGKGVGTWEPGPEDLKFAEKQRMSVEKYREYMTKLTAKQRSGGAGGVSDALAAQATEALKQANSEIEILKKLQPVAKKVAASAALKPTMMERLGSAASKAVPFAGAVGLGHILGGSGNGP